MAARKKSAARKQSAKRTKASSRSTRSAARARSSRAPDAITLLRADHKTVQGLFDKFEKARGDRKSAIAEQICTELTIHAQIEEEIFYPAARKALREEDLIDEATVEHQSAKDLIAQIQGSGPSNKLWEAKVKVLGEYIKHHVKEEQNEMFPQVKKTKLDMRALGEQLEARKTELKEGGKGATRSSGRGRQGSAKSQGFSGSSGRSKQSTTEESLMTRMARGIGLG